MLTNYDDYKDYAGWKVSVTAYRSDEQKDTFTFSALDNGPKYIRKAMDDGGLKGVTTRITAYAETISTDSKWMRSAQYEETAFIPATWMGESSQWSDQNGLANEKLTTSDITFTGNSVDNLTVKATLNFKPSYTAQGNPTYRVMLRAKYTGDETVTLNGQTFPLKGQYVTLAAQERTVANADTTFTLSDLPKDTLTNYEDWTAIAVPINSGVGDVVTRWKITEQEAAKSLTAYGTDSWWKNGLEIVRKADGTGYEYATLTPLCMVDTSHTEYLGWANAVAGKVKLVKMTKTILKAPTLAEDTDGGEVDAKNQLTYTFKWTQDGMKATDTAPNYQIKLYGLLTGADGTVTGQEQIALKDDVNLADKVQRSDSSFTLPVNVDTMLANGSDSWRYDKVRLEVTRVAAANTNEIGASAVADYSVKQRLPGISAPSSITRVNGETDNADALLYTVSWSPSADARIDHYDLCAVDDNDNTVLTLSTTGNVGSLTLDLEQYQGKALRFRVIARRKADSNCFDGPDGALSQSETIVSRAAAPTVTGSSFAPDSPNQETFLNDLKLNMTLDAAAEGNVYFTGYIFSNEDNYNKIAELAEAWQKLPAGQDKYKAQQALTNALNTMLANDDAELVIPKDSRTVGGSADANGTNASYTFVPDGNGFTLTPDHAKQYLLPAVRVMPTDGTTASNWFYIQQDAAAAQLPAITLDAPVDAAETERALGNAVYKQEVNLYNDPECKGERGKATLDLRRFTVEWTAVNKYTQADGTVRNLTDRYSFTVTPLDGKTKQPYTITVQTYDRDVTDDNGTTHKRGEIKTVTKTYDGKTMDLEKQTDETRTWYDLSVEPVTDENSNVTVWKSQPYDVTGTVEIEGGTLYYKAQTVPMLELVQEDGAEPVYRITLPELQEKVQDDSLELQKFTASVTLQTLAHSIGDKTVESGKVTVTVNGTNTAEAAEDAQSMDPAESMEDAEAVESTAAVSAPASLPPVLMRARAALPTATPETADAPDETDAAGTTPPEQTKTTDAS